MADNYGKSANRVPEMQNSTPKVMSERGKEQGGRGIEPGKPTKKGMRKSSSRSSSRR